MYNGTELLTTEIADPHQANRVFGERKAFGHTHVVLTPGRPPCVPWISVPDGMYALVQTSGADVDHPKGGAVWPAGYHYGGPFTRISHLITKQMIVFDTPVKGCKTMDNVTVQIDLAIFFRIMGDAALGEDPGLVRKFVYNLTPRGLQQQLKDSQEEAVRTLARSVRHEDVYTLRSATYGDDAEGSQLGTAVTSDMQRSMNEQFNPYGVQIVDVVITDVKLPAEFQHQMQEKTTYQSKVDEQEVRQRNDMQLLKQREDMGALEQEAQEQQERERQLGEKLATEERKKLDRIRAETDKLFAEMREENEAELLRIQAASDLEITQLVQEKNETLQRIAAQAEAECDQMKAENHAYVRQLEAETEVTVKTNEGRANEIVSEVEGQNSRLLRARREQALREKQLQIYEAMANNDELTIAGNTAENLLGEMLVAQRQSQIMLNVNT